LGAPNAMYLAAAGVGHLGLVDFDVVDASNLQRQVLHGTSHLRHPNMECARMVIYDALELSFKNISVRKDPECAVCGKNPTVTELIDYEAFCGVVSDEAQQAAAGATLTPAQLKALLDDGQQLKLVDVREPAEWQINRLPGATLIPLDTLPDHLAELPQTEPVVLYCKS